MAPGAASNRATTAPFSSRYAIAAAPIRRLKQSATLSASMSRYRRSKPNSSVTVAGAFGTVRNQPWSMPSLRTAAGADLDKGLGAIRLPAKMHELFRRGRRRAWPARARTRWPRGRRPGSGRRRHRSSLHGTVVVACAASAPRHMIAPFTTPAGKARTRGAGSIEARHGRGATQRPRGGLQLPGLLAECTMPTCLLRAVLPSLLGCGLALQVAHAEIYTWVDPAGVGSTSAMRHPPRASA